MSHREKLLEVVKEACSRYDASDIPEGVRDWVKTIGEYSYIQKGVYTVLVTLLVHKILHPRQDIRKHQASMPGGFSGRTIDTHSITPTLKELGLPSMAESGWLTRSLEQPFPYNLDYNGKISNREVKNAFLRILDYIQANPDKAHNVLRLLFTEVLLIKEANQVTIVPLLNPDILTIDSVIKTLIEHFESKYAVAGGAKLPVLAFYAIYSILVSELSRFEDCTLAELGSHTACDLTSDTAGDILVYKEDDLFEALEIKLGKPIDKKMVAVAIEKIIKHNPNRYYILSTANIFEEERADIVQQIGNLKRDHGCQLIINGVVPSLKYYFRLIKHLEDFMNLYSNLIERDSELNVEHQKKWNEILISNNMAEGD